LAAPAVVAALAPICVERFHQQADAETKLVEFKKVSSWDRRSIIEKGGWATMPGSGTLDSAVASGSHRSKSCVFGSAALRP
jgi:hypothetical protein